MNDINHTPGAVRKHARRGLAIGLGALAISVAAGAPAVATNRVEKGTHAEPSLAAYGALPLIAAHARANDLTGLSPASLRPVEVANASVSAGTDAASSAARQYAETNDLTGLSPASLTPRYR